MKFSFQSRSPEITRAFGAILARLVVDRAQNPCVIAMSGELGAGKTTFVGGFMSALGVVGPVRSPTYTLIEPYEAAGHLIYHLDLYRLASPKDLEMLALRDLLVPDAVLLIEWPERGAGELPTPDLRIRLHYSALNSSEERVIDVEPQGLLGNELAVSLQKAADELHVSPSFY